MDANGAGLILGLDHFTLAVAELDQAVAAYETLFAQPAARRGRTDGLAWARFDLANTALVLAAQEGAPGALSRHLDTPPGEARAALALAVAEPESALRLLGRRGLPAAGPALSWQDAPAMPLDPGAARGLHLMLTAARPAGDPASAIRLDHAVIRSADPERTLALLGGRLGLELRLDRSNPDWGTRLLFFRCGDLVLEVTHPLAEGIGEAPDTLWGLTWRVPDVTASHARLEAMGMPVSPLRIGRKPGTRLFTIRGEAAELPTAVIGA
jgi:catechol 2,3-dioxygenase-like lactoylglutathione lyase family enzyme